MDASLVVADERAGATRYRLLEPVRQYAAERLRLVGDEPSVRRRHAQHALALAEQAEPQLVRASAGVRLDRLAVEHDNLRAALAWSVDAGGSEELTARLAGSLWKFWWLWGHLDEGRRWLVRALGATCTPTARIKVLAGAGSLADYQNDYIQAEQLYREMLTLARASDDRVSTSLALNRLSDLKRLNTEDEQGTALAEESVVLARESGDELSVTLALATLGRAWIARGDHARAASAFEESMAVAREHGFVVTLSHTQGQLARILSVRGDIPRAITLCDEALDRFQQLGDRWGRESALRNRMSIARLQGDHERVIDLAAEALMLGHELGNRLALINTVARLAWAARQRGDPARAARMLGAADAIRDAVRVRLPEPDRSVFEADVATVRAMLGEAGFAEAWAEGRAMSLEQAVAYAMEDAGREEVAEPRPPA